MNQFIDSFVDQMILIHNKLQINEPSTESYPDVDLRMWKRIFFSKINLFFLDGYEFDSWKKFFEYTKQQESRIRISFKSFEFVLFL